MRLITCSMVAILVAALGGSRVMEAAEPAAGFKPGGPLAGLPSKAEGPHVEKIKALGDDQWLDLGSPAADPVWGRRLGASWTPRMAYAGELRAAFVTAGGAHGGTFMRNGQRHYNDDLFAYDINAHRWICIYPGANCQTLKLKLDEHGSEVDEQGNCVPVAYAGHGFNLQAYNPDLHKFVLIWNSDPWWKPALPQRNEWLGVPHEQWKEVYKSGRLIQTPKHPFFYDVSAGKWERKFVEGAGPEPKNFEGVVEYLPSRKQALFLHHGKIWFYDFAENRWIDPKAPTPPAPHTGYDCSACLDTRRERAYSGKGNVFCAYDVKTNAWSDTTEASKLPVVLGGGVCETMTYDSVNDVIVLNAYGHGDYYKGRTEDRGLYFYSPAEGKWLSDKPRALPKDYGTKARALTNAFYDPEFNVHYFFTAGDSYDNGTMWAYRYRNLKK